MSFAELRLYIWIMACFSHQKSLSMFPWHFYKHFPTYKTHFSHANLWHILSLTKQETIFNWIELNLTKNDRPVLWYCDEKLKDTGRHLDWRTRNGNGGLLIHDVGVQEHLIFTVSEYRNLVSPSPPTQPLAPSSRVREKPIGLSHVISWRKKQHPQTRKISIANTILHEENDYARMNISIPL